MKNTAKIVSGVVVRVLGMLFTPTLQIILFPCLLINTTLRCLWWAVLRIRQSVTAVAMACTWFVTAKVSSPRFVINATRTDCNGSPLVSLQGKKEHFDVLPWEITQGDDTIKVMAGYSNPPLGDLAPDKIQAYWLRLLEASKKGVNNSPKNSSQTAAVVLTGDLKAYFHDCKAVIIAEMQKARGLVNGLLKRVQEKGVGREIAKVNCSIPGEPDTRACLSRVANEPVISLEGLSFYNDWIEGEKKAYIDKMQTFQTRAKERYSLVYNAYHSGLNKIGGENEWALMQGAALLEGSQGTPSSLLKNQEGHTLTPETNGSAALHRQAAVNRRLFMEIPSNSPRGRAKIL